MYRGQVTAVDAKGVYVLVPSLHPTAAFGPLDHVGARPAVGARVLVADCGDESAPDLVVMTGGLPATSTDNAVARFDGTGGALQNSGVKIDDGGNITSGSVRAAKSTDTAVEVVSSGGEALVNIAASNAWLRFKSSSEVNRFAVFAIGDELRVRRFDASGGYLSDALKVGRTSGKVTLGDVGSTAGLGFGSSGPTITSGTGAPSHSAPNGSIWLRTDGTASTTLYVRAAGAWSALS